MKYRCIREIRGIKVGAICEVEALGVTALIYVTYNKDGRTRIMNYTTLKQHFIKEDETK